MPLPAPTVARHLATLRDKLAELRADPEARYADQCGPALRGAIYCLEQWRENWREWPNGYTEAEAAAVALCEAGSELHARAARWAVVCPHLFPQLPATLAAIAADAEALYPGIGSEWLILPDPAQGIVSGIFRRRNDRDEPATAAVEHLTP